MVLRDNENVLFFLRRLGRCYILTNQRLYIEEGVLFRSKREIQIHRITYLEFQQGFLRRLLGMRNLLVIADNDKPTVLKNVSKPEIFCKRLTESTGKKIPQVVA